MKVLYHASCNDGSGAALAAWLNLGDVGVEYIPVQYGSLPPDIGHENVYILDFSYPREILIDMAKVARMIVVLDHHKTAQADLAKEFPKTHDGRDLCPVHVYFDMDKSGAMMAWEYFHGPEEAPYLFKLIQDRDLWRFKFPETKAVAAALNTISDWRDWQAYLLAPASLTMNQLIASGDAILKFLDLQMAKILESEPCEWWDNSTVPLYNLPGFMISDTLSKVLEKYPKAPYAVAYFDLPNIRVYSLRSRKGTDVDVSEIAKAHGGGGHKHAAGFTKLR